MFDYFRGTIAGKGPTSLVLDVGGVGYAFECPLSTTEALPREGEARVWAWLYVREDAQKLYAFATKPERELFLMLQKVSGIGPGLALAILSRAPVDELCHAIAEERIDFLKSLKGVGAKTAQRLVTELRDRVAAVASEGSAARPAGAPLPIETDAIQALEVLGCPTKTAQGAVRQVLESDDGPRNLEEIVRGALRLVWPS